MKSKSLCFARLLRVAMKILVAAVVINSGQTVLVADELPDKLPQNLDAAIRILSEATPFVVPRGQPIDTEQKEPRYANVMATICDGVAHQFHVIDFNDWVEANVGSNIRELVIQVPYNPSGWNYVDLSRLHKWRRLRRLDLRDCMVQNASVTIDRDAHAYRAEQATVTPVFPSLEELRLGYFHDVDFATFPKLQVLHLLANQPQAVAEKAALLKDVQVIQAQHSQQGAPRDDVKIVYARQHLKSKGVEEEPAERIRVHCHGVSTLPDLKLQASFVELKYCEALVDISQIATRQTKKLRSLVLHNARALSDLSPLERVSSLEELTLIHPNQLADMAAVGRIPQLTSLNLVGLSPAIDLPFADLQTLTSLAIAEFDAPIDVASIVKLPRLTSLRLRSCPRLKKIGQLSSLQQLRQLDLSGTRVLDVDRIAELENLESLNLNHAWQLTSLDKLHRLKNLRRLVVTNCPNLPMSAIRKLQAAMPECTVHFDVRFPN